MTKRINIAYAGTPDFSATILGAILRAGFHVSLVLTQADRQAGRGMKLHASSVKRLALEARIPVLQPLSLNLNGPQREDAFEVHHKLLSMQCDVLIVAAYGMLLPPSILSIPVYGCVNVHASLLPRWRGAAPIQRAIQAGDVQTGITMMLMDAGLDTGPIISQASLPISDADTGKSLCLKLAALGSECVVETLHDFSSRTPPFLTRQSDLEATYASKLSKSDALIDWKKSAVEIARLVRSLDSYPGAASRIGEQRIKIWRVEVVRNEIFSLYLPGEIIGLTSNDLIIGTADYPLRILELQRPGGRRLLARDFLSGCPWSIGEVFC